MPDPEPLAAAAAALVLLGVFASKLSDRLGVPALLLFLLIGMLAGSDGIGGIEFDDYALAQSVGVVALAFILFAGGLDTEWRDVRPVLANGLLLSTVGVALTAVLSGLVASSVLGLPVETGLLLGAIVSSTDAAAVFSVLRSRNVSLRGQVRPTLELESGSNDPMAAFLTIGFLALVDDPSRSVIGLVPLFLQQMTVGFVVGYLGALVAVVTLNRLNLGYDGLYPVVTVALVVLAYSATTLAGGSGFLAVYVAGLTMGNARFIHKKSLTRFHDAIAWLSQISMFLLLGLLVFPSDLLEVALRALLLSAFLVLVARPVAVFASLVTWRAAVREKVMISWVGLRGAVPIILATFPLVEGIPAAEEIFNVVFFIVLTSVLLQGTTVPLAARRLRVQAAVAARPRAPLEFVSAGDAGVDLHELEVAPGSLAAGRRLVELGLPEGALVVLVIRKGEYFVPQGATLLEPADTVLVLASGDLLPAVREVFESAA